MTPRCCLMVSCVAAIAVWSSSIAFSIFLTVAFNSRVSFLHCSLQPPPLGILTGSFSVAAAGLLRAPRVCVIAAPLTSDLFVTLRCACTCGAGLGGRVSFGLPEVTSAHFTSSGSALLLSRLATPFCS
ncbi:hypothetical protein MRX96_059390 [Rhipicephalus microplus]